MLMLVTEKKMDREGEGPFQEGAFESQLNSPVAAITEAHVEMLAS